MNGIHFPSGRCRSILTLYAVGESSLIVTRDLTFWPPIVHSSTRGAKDDLLGVKENIVIGHLIPAGSGIYRYAEIDIEPSAGYEAPPRGWRSRWRRCHSRR